MLTQQEWDVLSPEEQTKRQSEKPASPAPEVKEDVVIIDGKPRPLKNYLSEITRKVTEDVRRDLTPASPQPAVEKATSTDFTKQILLDAEREMEETGQVVPVNTILRLISQGSQYHIREAMGSSKSAQKMVKEVRKELKSQYKDFGEYEDEFDEIVDNIEPKFVTKDGLKIVFDSLRGKRLDVIIKKKEEAATKKAEEERRIIGDTSEGTAAASKPKSVKLTEEQAKEMKDMGFETEEDYLGRLEKKRAVAKKQGAKNVPETIAERFVF